MTTFPKFVLYSAHAETLAPLMIAFKTGRAHRCDPGSAIFLEFYERAGHNYVRSYFKESAGSADQVIEIPGAAAEDDGAVPIEAFAAFVNNTLLEYDDPEQGGIAGDVEAACKVDVAADR